MKPFNNVCVVLACASLLLGQSGCKVLEPVVSTTQFEQKAYDNDKAVKTQALALIDRGKNRAAYSSVAADADQLLAKIDSSISTEAARPKSGPTVGQWKKIRAQMSDLFNQWKKKGSLSPALVDQYKTQVSESFDLLMKTEQDKPRKT